MHRNSHSSGGGDDPSEIYQVREYRERDSLKDIHWKLSAREEELMVKERGFPLGCVVLIKITEKKMIAGRQNSLQTDFEDAGDCCFIVYYFDRRKMYPHGGMV